MKWWRDIVISRAHSYNFRRPILSDAARSDYRRAPQDGAIVKLRQSNEENDLKSQLQEYILYKLIPGLAEADQAMWTPCDTLQSI